MKKLISIAILSAMAALTSRAAGPLAPWSSTFTNSVSYTNTGSPQYIEFIDVSCPGATTNWTVTLNNGNGITVTLLSQYITNSASISSTPERRIEKGGIVTFTCGDVSVTNKVTIYPFAK